MEIVGLPLDLLFTGLFVLVGFVYVNDRVLLNKRCDKLEKTLDDSKKQLSKEEFNELKDVVKQEVTHVLDSKGFREDLKGVVRDVLLHCNKTSSIQMLSVVESINSLSKEIKSLSRKNQLTLVSNDKEF